MDCCCYCYYYFYTSSLSSSTATRGMTRLIPSSRSSYEGP